MSEQKDPYIEQNKPGWLKSWIPFLTAHNIDPLETVEGGTILTTNEDGGLGFRFNRGGINEMLVDYEADHVTKLSSDIKNFESKGKKALIKTIVATGITAGLTFVARYGLSEVLPQEITTDLVACVVPIVPATIGFVVYKFHEMNVQIHKEWRRNAQRALHKSQQASVQESDALELTRRLQMRDLSGGGRGFG